MLYPLSYGGWAGSCYRAAGRGFALTRRLRLNCVRFSAI